MTIEIKLLTMGIAVTNCYIIGDTETNRAIVIDPVENAPLIYKTAQENDWEIDLILATHGHFDHVLASKELKELTGAPFHIHEECVPFLERLPHTGLDFIGEFFPEAAKPDQFLTTEPQTIEVGAIRLETLYTPGHAPGHISFLMPDGRILFSGDTLFKGSVGRTDLPGSNQAQLMRSIREKLLPLGDDVRVLAGHMELTTIGDEKRSNPFLHLYG